MCFSPVLHSACFCLSFVYFINIKTAISFRMFFFLGKVHLVLNPLNVLLQENKCVVCEL